MGLVDGALVGKLGTKALAAYGIAFFITFIHAGVLMGLASAVQAITARSIGNNHHKSAAYSLNSAIIVSIVFGGLLSLLANGYKNFLLSYTTKDQEVIALASSYLEMRFIGIFAIGITHSFRGFWNGIGKPTTYLVIMTLSYVVNALLSYAFLFGSWGMPILGLSGVALGSTIATIIAAMMNFSWAFFHTRSYGFGKKYFQKDVWKNLLEQSLPAGLTQLLFALGYAVFFAIIGRLGASELAAANILVTISLFLIYPGMAMGMTAATYVGQSLGAMDKKGAFLWTKHVALYSIFLFGFLSIPFLIFRREILALFIHDPNVLEIALLPFIIFLCTLILEILGQVYTFAFLGAGKPKVILFVTIAIQWIGVIPFSYFFGKDLLTIWVIHIGFRCLQTGILFFSWRKSYSLSDS